MRYLGIDPGKTGGMAAIEHVGSGIRIIGAVKMPSTNPEILEAIRTLAGAEYGDPAIGAVCALEYVRSRPGLSSVAMFTFGRGLGALEMALASVGVPYDDITPQRWQTALGCMSAGDKNVTKARAMKLFPNWNKKNAITHATADALLLAEYCRRFHRGLIGRKRR